MRDYRAELLAQLQHCGELLHRWMEQERHAAERRLGLPSRDPATVHDASYAAALAAWATWRDVIDDIHPLLATPLAADPVDDRADEAAE